MADPDRSLLERLAMNSQGAAASGPLPGDGGGGTYDGMDAGSLHTRLARLEGGNAILLVTSGIVAAVFLGLSAATLYVALDTRSELRSEVSGLRSDVQGLPDQINRNLLELNRTLADSITAARSNQPAVAPIIIQVPAQQSAPAPAP